MNIHDWGRERAEGSLTDLKVEPWVLVDRATLSSTSPALMFATDDLTNLVALHAPPQMSALADEAFCMAARVAQGSAKASDGALVALPFGVASLIANLIETRHDLTAESRQLQNLLGSITLSLDDADGTPVKVVRDGDQGDPSVGLSASEWWELEPGFEVVRTSTLQSLTNAVGWGRACAKAVLGQRIDLDALNQFVAEADRLVPDDTRPLALAQGL